MTFQDIFKSSFLQNASAVTPFDAVIALTLAFCMGLYLYWIYRSTYIGVMFSVSFGITLLAMTMITTILILAVSSNVVLSLGMVGALSIVRFRTAIKEPMDLAFLFWSMETGIVLASGMIPLGVIANILIGLILLGFIRHRPSSVPYILVLRCGNEEERNKVIHYLDETALRYVIKSEISRPDGIEMDVELRLSADNVSGTLRKERFMRELRELTNVDASLVSYNGDYMG